MLVSATIQQREFRQAHHVGDVSPPGADSPIYLVSTQSFSFSAYGAAAVLADVSSDSGLPRGRSTGGQGGAVMLHMAQ